MRRPAVPQSIATLIAIAILSISVSTGRGQEQEPNIDDRSLGLLRKLQQVTPLQPERVMIRELPSHLAQHTGWDCELDSYEFSLTGVSPEYEIELSSQKRSLASALTVALEPIGLAWTIKQESLWITSAEAAESEQVTIPYDVTHVLEIPQSLLAFAEFKSGEAQELIEQLENEVSPDDWESVGGPGVIHARRSQGRMELIVSQNWSNHTLIHTYLARHRRHPLGAGEQHQDAFSRPFLQVYALKEANEPDEIVATIQELVLEAHPPGVTELRVVSRGLVVKGTWDSQLRIRDFLVGIGELEKPKPQGLFGDFGFGGSEFDDPYDSADHEPDGNPLEQPPGDQSGTDKNPFID